MKSIAKLLLLFFLFINLVNNEANAQSYRSACGLGLAIPDNSCGIAPFVYPISVGGAVGSQMGLNVVLAQVDIVISHTFDADLEIYLESPSGKIVPLSVSNGLSANNYGDPLDVSCASVTSFTRSAMLSITAGIAPFIGSFRPQGDFSDFDDGTTPNGEWHLIICDGFPAEAGILEFVSLYFTTPCEQPVIDAVIASSADAEVEFSSFNSGATYTIEWGVTGFTPGGIGSLGSVSGTSSSGNNSRVFTGLLPITEYEVYLSEDCGALKSLSDGPYYFITTKQNDLCSNAIPVSCGVTRIDSTILGATDTDAPGSCGGMNHNESPGLWFIYAGNGADVTVSLCGASTDYDTRIGVFAGPCQDLSCVDADDDFCGTGSEITFTSQAGIDYYIYVSGSGGEIGTFEMSVSCSVGLVINEVDYAQPGTDDAEFIELVNKGSSVVNIEDFSILLIDGTAGGASIYNSIALPDFDLVPGGYFVLCGDSVNVSNCNMHLGSNDFLRDGSPDAIVLMLGSTQIDVVSYNGNTGAPYTEGSGVGLEDDSTALKSGISRLPDGFDSDVNNTDFGQSCISPGISNTSQSAACSVVNDSCAHATLITPGVGIHFDNRGATTDGGGDPLCSSGGNDTIFSDVWFLFIPDCNGDATFSTIGGTYNTKIAVYENTCNGTIVGCNDDTLGTEQSIISWTAVSGTSYLLRLGGFSKTQQDAGTFDLTLTEFIAPSITCGSDKAKNADQGVCTATVNPASPVASDNCSNVTLVNDFTGASSAQGAYSLGTTVITWTATDASGNTATCQQNVVVTDTEKPAITCPLDIIQTADADTCGALVSVPLPIVSDNCSIDAVANDFNSTPDASDFYPVGATTIFWTVDDASGSSNGCIQRITITDNQRPLIACPGDYEIPLCDSFGIVPVPSFDDNCGIASFINNYNLTPDASDIYNVGSTAVTWTVTDLSGNTSSCSLNVTRNQHPLITITPEPASICKSTYAVFFGNPVAGSSGIESYLWTSANIVGAANADSVTLNVSVAGLFGPVKYMVTDSNGCSVTDSIFVTVLESPAANIVQDTVVVCDASSVQLDGNPFGGNGSLTNLWTGDTLSLSSTSVADPDFNATAAGSYALIYTVTDSLGCSGTDAVTVIVNAVPSVMLSASSASACEDSVILLDASVVPGSGSITGQGWTGDTIPLSSTIITGPTFASATPGTYNLSFSVTDDNLCSAVDNIAITVNANPVVSFAGLALSYCLDDQADTLVGTPSGGSFAGPGTGGGPFTDAFNPMLADTGFHNVNYTFTDGNGCANTSSQTVIINPLPIADAGADASICTGESVILQATGGASYQWSTGSSTDTTTVNPTSNTNYQVTATNSSGCMDDDEVTIKVNLLPAITFTGLEVQYCLNDESDTLVGTPVGGVFSGSGVNNIGEVRDTFDLIGSPVAILDTSSVESLNTVSGVSGISLGSDILLESVCFKIQHDYVEDIVVTLYSPAGDSVVLTKLPCGDFSDLDVCIVPGTGNSMDVAACNAIPPALSGSFTASSNEGDNLGFFNNTFTNPNGDWRLKVEDVVPGFTGQIDGFSLNFRTLGIATFNPGDAGIGIKNVSYTFTDANGCTGSSAVLTSVSDIPSATATPDTSICAGGNLFLTATGGSSYSWNTGASTDTVTVTPAISIDYIVTVTGNNACAARDTVSVIVFPPAIIDAGANQTICSGSPAALTASGGVTYSWSTGDNTAAIFVSPSALTNYHVAAVDSNGCFGTDSVTVKVLPLPIAIPGADKEICKGDTAIISASGGNSYSWNDGITTASRPANPLVTSTYMVTVMGANSCADTASVTVTVHQLPSVTLSGLNTNYCNNDNPDTLSGTPSGGFFGGPAIIGNVFFPTLLSPGTHTMSYTYIDSFGCASTDSRTTLINNAPLNTSIIGLKPEYCVDTSINQLTGSPSGGFFSGPGMSGNKFISYYAGQGTHNIVYTYDAGGLCPGRDTQSVTVHPLPVVSIIGLNPSHCLEDSAVQLKGLPAGGTFSGTGVFEEMFYPNQVVVGAPNAIRYEYMDSNGCAGKKQVITTAYANPHPIIINPGELCVNSRSVALTGSPAGGLFSGAGITNNVLAPSIAGVGIHSVEYSTTDNRGCYGDTAIFITVNDLPAVTLSEIDSAYCVNSAVVTLSGTPSGGIYSGEGVIAFTFYPAVAETGGPYGITYAYTDEHGCTASDTKFTSVVNSPFLVITGLEPVYCIDAAPVPINVLPEGGTLLGAGVSDGVFNPRGAGTGTHIISYLFSNAIGCVELEKTFVKVEACTGMSDPGLEGKVSVFPNPTEGRFTLELRGMDSGDGVARIYDVAGRMVSEENISVTDNSYLKEFDLTAFPKGIYHLRLSLSGGTIVSKIIVQ